MRTISVVIAAAAIVAAGGVFLMQSDGPAEPVLGPVDGYDLPGVELDRVTVGTEAPDFSLRALSGDVITLSDYRGEKNVVLVFYRGHW